MNFQLNAVNNANKQNIFHCTFFPRHFGWHLQHICIIFACITSLDISKHSN